MHFHALFLWPRETTAQKTPVLSKKQIKAGALVDKITPKYNTERESAGSAISGAFVVAARATTSGR